MIPPKIVIEGDRTITDPFIGFAKKELKKLGKDMSYQKINEAYRILHPAPGVEITVAQSFSLQKIIITTIPIEEPIEPRVPIEKEVTETYLKVFVHVDVLDDVDWDINETDRLSRSMINSSIACGILNIISGDIILSSVLSTEYLVEGGGTTWDGVIGAISSTVTGCLTYYNSLFPGAVDIPTIDTSWITIASNSIWSTTNTGRNYDLKSTYLCANAVIDTNHWGCEKETAAAIGWCEDTYSMYDLTQGGVYVNGGESIINYGDLYKNTDQNGDSSCGQTASSWYRYYPYGTWSGTLPYNPDNHTHYYCYEPLIIGEDTYEIQMQEIMHFTSRLYHKSPILGLMWSGPYRIFDRELWFQSFCGSVDHTIQSYLYEFIEVGYDSMPAPFPYAATSSYLPSDYIINIGTELNMNYILPTGFSWFQGFVGGLISSEDVQTGPSTSIGTKSFKTLLSIGAKGGYNMSVLDDPISSFSSSLATLTKAAIANSGGTIYDNSTIPTSPVSNPKDNLTDYLADAETELSDLPGIVYASPLFNIKIYAFPVENIL